MARTCIRTRQVCRNTKMPDGLTDQFKAKILSLGQSAKAEHLKREVFSKFLSDDVAPAPLRRNRAIFKWLVTERENESTNERLLTTSGEYNILPRVSFDRFVSFCRDLVIEIIGDTPPEQALLGTFSGGASTSRKRTESHPARKYTGKAHVTDRCLDWVPLLEELAPGWLSAGHDISLEVVPGNVMFTVPKKSDIDRVACKEPDINMFIQKGIGNHIRDSLLRAGINLNDQSINRSLARVGSIDRSLATLDLSSASDSVSRELVSLFLPEAWFTLLDAVRCHVTIIDGEEHRNEMFSSMGNGFTFELESLLFYVLTRATTYFRGISGIVSVYGDDIICPTKAAHDVIFVLRYFGFTTNEEKSFIDGPFRESCGGHYLDGYDITPFYVKGPLNRLVDVIDVANKLRKWATIPHLGILDPEVEDIWLWLKGHIPKHLWGGEDLTFKYQLVSYDLPSMRLHKETKRRSTGIGGILHFLNLTDSRRWEPLLSQRGPSSPEAYSEWDKAWVPPDAVSTALESQDRETYRARPVLNPTVPSLPALFLSELG